ncbi:alpha/beta hydrolase [Novosphingobium pokkalii]|uniref:Alpha/beta hydrolase n=1 Tax=Novosphingobium pokkalii TaxID=1770194 RepID=A0ABV7V6F9_9SPHN|nr:alpha/beta hydrolase [Novosphingobium pokkalii]GHD03995.1 hypothetical protein GCM10019060_40510 [Novosphingobium pokkalii]
MALRFRRIAATALALLGLSAWCGVALARSLPAPSETSAPILLYPAGAPGGAGPDAGFPAETRATLPESGETMVFNVSVPTLERFAPQKGHSNGTAVIVAPGGGFVGIGYRAGGTAIAQRLAGLGITAFVLKYRTIVSPDDAMHMPAQHVHEMAAIEARAKSGSPAQIAPFAGEPHAVADGARALELVRAHAATWGIDPHRVGILGLSAGAFLAADLAIGPPASRPDFVALLYGGLRGPVPSDAPPAFIAAAADDPYVPDDAALLFAAWRKAGVPAELHIYERGGHGFDLAAKGAPSDHWFAQFTWWMQARGLIAHSRPAPRPKRIRP